MNLEVDDPDVYHQDFTTASAWEEFVDRIEKIVVDWKLNQPKTRLPLKKGDLDGEWTTKTEEIHFEGEKFSLTSWSLKDTSIISSEEPEPDNPSANVPQLQCLVDMMSTSGDFVTVASCPRIAQFYGIRDFLLLKSDVRNITSETQAKILLSSLTMALHATGCEIPAFVQILELWQHFYLGSCLGKELSADYEMVHLERTPQHCKYLTGLLDTFKSKISRGQQPPPINIAVRLTYTLRMLSPWKTSIPTDLATSVSMVPFGTGSDPISKLHLLATWPQLNDQMVVDSQSYSDLEPMQAHLWSMQIELAKNAKGPQLSQLLASLCKMSSEPLAPFIVDCPRNPKFGNSLDALTESKVPTFSKVLDKVITGNPSVINRQRNKQGAIPESSLKDILYYLFPDAVTDPSTTVPYPYPSFETGKLSSPSKENQRNHIVKSAPPDSLVWRLALLLPLMYNSSRSTPGAAHVWYEFTEEMRYRWEKAIPIPGVMPGYADHKTCLLHQKLQMLNVCIEKKKLRASLAVGKGSAAVSVDSEGEDDDQFFDCDTSGPSGAAAEDAEMEDAQDTADGKRSLWDQPEGRKAKHPTLRLLKTGEPLYIPLTQDLVPKSEDEVEHETAAAHLSQAHAYSCTVTLSDMESFKAANPDAALEDFVRWYSPRDWVELPDAPLDEWGQVQGELSERMRLDDNMWQNLWSVAQPVPALRQRRLFDETRSAESVLAWLEGLSALDLALALLPVTAHACATRVLQEVHADDLLRRLPGPPAAAETLARHVAAATREPLQTAPLGNVLPAGAAKTAAKTAAKETVKLYERLVSEVEAVETQVCTARSLRSKLCPGLFEAQSEAEAAVSDSQKEMVDFLSALLELKEVLVPGGARGRIGSNVRGMFAEAQKMAQMLPDAATGRPEWSAASPDLPASGPSGASASTASFPPADVKEVVMRVVTPRPSAASKPCPQRIYAMHRKDEFRLAGCFARDATFY
ncbi:rab3 GTPase-activating protein catalytic subunit [Thrips palmi]|uniref:Rab3 GTPase-activating protein catalytic subunit n=1 Tax=Thrips palmi TaxID=161013 RepID=A0A6P8Y642_THRPL|nr:rab3 GTPase-activating protein catalytic subunit [Thrips palmi]